MHRANVAIFLTAVGLIGVAPIVLSVVYLARKRHDMRATDDGAADNRSTVIVVVVVMAVLVAGGGAAAWVLAARGLAPPASGRLDGIADTRNAGGMPATDSGGGGMRMSLPVLDRLGGLRLTSSIAGPDAVDQVGILHGSTFPIRDAVIATYGNGRATIWVSLAPDRGTAARQVSTMAERIGSSESPFTVPSTVPGLRAVYATSGMGQSHVFFARGAAVWWIAADPSVASAVLDDALEVAG